jgi:hypothetical protein
MRLSWPGAQRTRGSDRAAASSAGSTTSSAMPVTTTLQPVSVVVSMSSTSNATTACDVAALSLVPSPVRNRMRRPSQRKLTGRTVGRAPLVMAMRPSTAVESRRKLSSRPSTSRPLRSSSISSRPPR